MNFAGFHVVHTNQPSQSSPFNSSVFFVFFTQMPLWDLWVMSFLLPVTTGSANGSRHQSALNRFYHCKRFVCFYKIMLIPWMKRRNLSWLPWIKHSRLWTGYKWAPQIGNSSPLPSFPSSCLLGGCMRSGWNKHPLVTRVSYANMSYNGRSKIISPFSLYRKKKTAWRCTVFAELSSTIFCSFFSGLWK